MVERVSPANVNPNWKKSEVNFDDLKRNQPENDQYYEPDIIEKCDSISNIARASISVKNLPITPLLPQNPKKLPSLEKSLKKAKSNNEEYVAQDMNLKAQERVSFGSFMKSCVVKKSKIELEKEALLKKEKLYKISKGMMEEESLPGQRNSPQLAESEILNIQVSKFEDSNDGINQSISRFSRNSGRQYAPCTVS